MCYKLLHGLVDLVFSCFLTAHCIPQPEEICLNSLNCLLFLSVTRIILVIVFLIYGIC